MKKTKVLITVDSLNSGGTERQVMELVKGFHGSDSIAVSVLTLTKNGYYDNLVKTYTSLFSITERPSDWKQISSLSRLYKLIKNNRFDIVHTMSLEDSMMIFLLSKFLDFKWINGSIRDADASKNRRQLQKRFLLRRSKFIVANSLAGLKVYNINLNRYARVIYNGVDPNRFQLKSANSSNMSTGEICLCSVANLSSYKDYFTLIDAIELSRDMPLSLHIFGDGPMREVFEARVRDKQLEGKIRFYGSVSNVESFLPTMDCGVLMSFKRSGEGLPNAILEFLSSGVPVIASNVGGVSEIVENGFNGLLVEPEDAFSLSEAFKKIVSDRNYLAFLSGNALSVIQRKFTLGRMMKEYVTYYNEVTHE